eukprot:TRINITY_DN6638_c0_g1_i1.p1 TRINITY_DN6638_c0_g1~~TRINITY_DN6638_c0_g1_i1.p1  ORF type:complete len:1180 (+),score=471.40 TRINITY_DN6638_c0_g1_i1:278-3541(+)
MKDFVSEEENNSRRTSSSSWNRFSGIFMSTNKSPSRFSSIGNSNSAEDHAPPAKIELECGALKKLGFINPDFKLRWFSLFREGETVKLSYSKTNFDRKPINTIVIDKDTRVEEEREIGFKVFDPIRRRHRNFWLCAHSNNEREKWVRVLQNVIREDREAQERLEIVTVPSILNCSSNYFEEAPPDTKMNNISNGNSANQSAFPLPNHMKSTVEINRRRAFSVARHRHRKGNVSWKRWKNFVIEGNTSLVHSNGSVLPVILLVGANCLFISQFLVRMMGEPPINYRVRIVLKSDIRTLLNDDCLKHFLDLGGELVLFYSLSKLHLLFTDVKKLVLFSEVENLSDLEASFLSEASKLKTDHVIKMNMSGTEKYYNGHNEDHLDEMLVKSGLSFTMIKYNPFMNSFLIDGPLKSALFEMPISENCKISWLNMEDLVDAVEKIIWEPKKQNRFYCFTGPQALSFIEVAEILSSVAHKKIAFKQIGEDKTKSRLIESAGLPDWLATSYVELFKQLQNNQEVKAVVPTLETVLGREPISFQTFVKNYSSMFLEPYLEHFTLGSPELSSIRNQFERFGLSVNNSPSSSSNSTSNEVKKSAFIHWIGSILNDEEIGESLFRGFEKRSKESLTFKEYVTGMGKLTKGTLNEKLRFVFRMYENVGKIDEQKFICCAKSLRRLTKGSKLSEESEGMLKDIFEGLNGGNKVTFPMFVEGLSVNNNFLDLLGLNPMEWEGTNPMKRGGIFMGHESWDLAESLAIGISNSVKKVREAFPIKEPVHSVEYIQSLELKFGQTESVSVSRPNIPNSAVKEFVDFDSFGFYYIRALFGINIETYLSSFSTESLFGTLVEVVSTGRSGSFFFKTLDDRYLLKTLPTGEALLFQKNLPDYFKYVCNNRDTLLIKFYGLHQLIYRGTSIYFVVMENIFDTPLAIHERYDLKGSTHDRKVIPRPGVDEALKDQNFNEAGKQIVLGPTLREEFIKQLESDSKWLEERNICDYSLLIGIHNRDKQIGLLPPNKKSMNSRWRTFYGGTESAIEKEGTSNQVYFFGIIDILTVYDFKKASESFIKNTFHKDVSAAPPLPYRERFVKYISSKAV